MVDVGDQRGLVEAGVAALSRGELVCFPTETTYGLAADIRSRVALDRLTALKGRSPDRPFGLIVDAVARARELASAWPIGAAELAARYWPGPLTMVLPARADLAAEVVAGGGVGVRVSSHPVAAALAAGLGSAITATSANPAGQPAALCIAEARAYFGAAVALYIDAGPVAAPTASTVVRIGQDGAVEVLRQGMIVIG